MCVVGFKITKCICDCQCCTVHFDTLFIMDIWAEIKYSSQCEYPTDPVCPVSPVCSSFRGFDVRCNQTSSKIREMMEMFLGLEEIEDLGMWRGRVVQIGAGQRKESSSLSYSRCWDCCRESF